MIEDRVSKFELRGTVNLHLHSTVVHRKLQPSKVCKNRWLRQEHGNRAEDYKFKVTNADYVEKSGKQ